MDHNGRIKTMLNSTLYDGTSHYSPPPDDYALLKAGILLCTSTIGLIGNTVSLLMVIAVRKLHKTYNAFFVHHCILDVIKSIYCIIFTKSMFKDQPPTNCPVVGATFIVFVTVSSINILAIVVNETYHFSNRVSGIETKNTCCVLFGVGITWFASIVINLGVAFLPSNPAFDRKVGYCTFMYGVTGNYLLYLLWIILITFALALSSFFLHRLWLDIKARSCFRVNNLFHHTSQDYVGEDVNTSPTEKDLLYRKNINSIIQVTKKNFFLLSSMVASVVICWYPQFILTLVDPKFKIAAAKYKTLTILGWSHSALTPIFFLGYNISSLKEIRWILKHGPKKAKQSKLKVNLLLQDTPTDTAQSRSPIRPNSLNVTPAYDCKDHDNITVCSHSSATRNSLQTQQCATQDEINPTTKSNNKSRTNGELSQEVVKQLLDRKLSPDFVEKVIELQRGSSSVTISNTCPQDLRKLTSPVPNTCPQDLRKLTSSISNTCPQDLRKLTSPGNCLTETEESNKPLTKHENKPLTTRRSTMPNHTRELKVDVINYNTMPKSSTDNPANTATTRMRYSFSSDHIVEEPRWV